MKIVLIQKWMVIGMGFLVRMIPGFDLGTGFENLK